MSYKIGFDGIESAELKMLLQSVENRVNGLGMHVETSDTGASTVASGTQSPPYTDNNPCPNGVKIGHFCVHYAVVVALVIVVVVLVAFVATKLRAGPPQ